MEYTEAQLSQVEKLASIYMKISDMAIVLDVPAEQLRFDISQDTEISKRYKRGKLTTKAKLLQQEVTLAAVGSPLAIENSHKNLRDMEDDEDF